MPVEEGSAGGKRMSQWREWLLEEALVSGSLPKAQCMALGSLFSLEGLLSRGDFSRKAVYLALL